MIWRIERLGRSLKHLIETVEQLMERGMGFRLMMGASFASRIL
ncbi:MAG: recombinase family protein [Chlorobiales bacterium]|nr:recombinase family protein [Chlorobiales bacterium]